MTRGTVAGIAYVKAIRGNYLNYLSGNKVRIPGVRLTSSGLPVAFGPLLKYFSGSGPQAEMLQFLNTILFSTRALKSSPQLDTSAITLPSKRGYEFSDIGLYATDFWKAMGYFHKDHIPRPLKFRRFHFTTKSGPLGHALASWVDDLFSLPDQLAESIKTLGGWKMVEFMDAAFGLEDLVRGMSTQYKAPKSAWPLRRLSFFADKEGKTRVIAIMDYFSQTVLKGLHSYLFRALKKIPQDMTFNQGAFKERIVDWPIFYSVDLSSATDRFPIELISQVLKGHLPATYVRAWEDVMVGYPFKVPGESNCINYSVGNPMGAYSSWASFTLAHHYIFFYISRLLGKDWKTLRYTLLGDDVLIGDKEVGELYLQVITDLGVDVSLAKTHISLTTLEFAKRWIHKGQEISPVPISALKQVGRKYYLLAAFLIELESKGFDFSGGIQQVVQSFFSMIHSKRRSFARSLGDKAYIVERVMRIIRGAPAAEHLNQVSRHLGIPLTIVSDRTANRLLASIALKLFNESDPARKTGGKPLGLLAEQIVMFLTGQLEERPEAMALLDSPLLHAYGNIEQSYLDLIKMTRNSDFIGPTGNWPLLVRSMQIPLSDEIFIDRDAGTEAMGASRICKLVSEKLKSQLSIGTCEEIIF